MKRLKVSFSKLIGRHYAIDEKMEILNWMLRTGKNHDVVTGRWDVAGVGQQIFDYSGNPHDYICTMPFDTEWLSWHFDAIFARAVFLEPSNPAIINWRKAENIYPYKYRMIQCNTEGLDNYDRMRKIASFDGKYMIKEFAHPDSKRTEPKIIELCIYTIGNGWIVSYTFSFKEFDYEPGWDFHIHQSEDESIRDFFDRAIIHLSEATLTTQQEDKQ